MGNKTTETDPINVLYLIDSLTHGGTERQVAELIRNLDRKVIRAHLCTLKPSSGLYEELDIPKECLSFSSFGSTSLIGVLLRLSGFIRNNRINIVQTFFQDPFLLAALVKPFHNIKLIGSFRDLGFWRNSSESRKMRFACRFFDGFIANSQAVKEHFASRDNLPADKIEVIYNGFDCSAIPAFRPDNALASKVVGIVANLNRPVKRVHDFIAAAAIVSKEITDVSFVIVGGGHLQQELETMAAELGIAGKTTFTGMVTDPLQYVKNFSIGVITSETEGFCNAIIEYMACGVPVVATRVGGNPELLEDGVNGFFCQPGDYAKLADVIIRLLESPEIRQRIGAENRTRIIQCFSIDSMIRHTESYYLSLGAVHG